MRHAVSVAVALVLLCSWTASASAQTTRPTTRPTGKSAEEMLDQLLKPGSDVAKPIQPATNVQPAGVDATSGAGAVAPGAPTVTLMREGTDVVNRTGRLTRSADGQHWEFTFESDGRSMLDPPVIVLPNLTLMRMESGLASANRDLRFRVTGEVTEYKGRNYILLRKCSVVTEAEKQF